MPRNSSCHEIQFESHSLLSINKNFYQKEGQKSTICGCFYGFWSRGLVKSRQKNWRESRSRETKVGEKIAVTSI